MSTPTAKPNKPKHTSKKDKNKHKKNRPSKHFIGTGQAAPQKSSSSYKKKFHHQNEEDKAFFGPREITSNAEKYDIKEERNEDEEFKQRTVSTLLKEQSAGFSAYRKSWEQDWDNTELLDEHVRNTIASNLLIKARHLFY